MSDSVWPHRRQPPGSPVPGILQARTLEWVAISFSSAWKWKVKAKSLSHVRLLATPWTAAWYWLLGAGALGRPRGMVWGGRREEGSGWGTHVYLWWIHFDIWQNQYNIVKFKNKIKKKRIFLQGHVKILPQVYEEEPVNSVNWSRQWYGSKIDGVKHAVTAVSLQT